MSLEAEKAIPEEVIGEKLLSIHVIRKVYWCSFSGKIHLEFGSESQPLCAYPKLSSKIIGHSRNWNGTLNLVSISSTGPMGQGNLIYSRVFQH